MLNLLRFSAIFIMIFCFLSCSSGNSEDDSDTVPDSDVIETVDEDTDSEEDIENIDDSDETDDDADSDSDPDECQPPLSEAQFPYYDTNGKITFAARIATLRPKKIPFASAISGMSRMKNFVMNALNTHVVVFHAQWKVLSL